MEVVNLAAIRNQDCITCIGGQRLILMETGQERKSNLIPSAYNNDVDVAKGISRSEGYFGWNEIFFLESRILIVSSWCFE